MDTTSASLLRRLQHDNTEEAWERFVELYTPLIYHWSRRSGLSTTDAADLVQEVFVILVDKLPTFQHNGQKSFRGWLRTVAQNKCRDLLRRRTLAPRSNQLDDTLQVPVVDDIQLFTEREYECDISRRALELMQNEFEPTTWRACWESITSNRSTSEIAASLEISVNAVYLAKSRVLRRLREELNGLFQ